MTDQMITLTFPYGETRECPECGAHEWAKVRNYMLTCVNCGKEANEGWVRADNTSTPVNTFPYGETPEDVIRERLAWYRDSLEHGQTLAGLPTSPFICGPSAEYLTGDDLEPISADDLLTVLDALRLASRTQVIWGDGTAAKMDRGRRARARQLRIAILAALGIAER